MTGDNNAVRGIHLGSQMTVAELLKVLGKLPPLALISLCNKELGNYVKEHLLQHGADLDFVQDVLSATGGNLELNPILNSVLAGFSRRKTYGRFKCGQLNLDFDRLRYANTITPKDSDLHAKEVTQNKQSDAVSSPGKGVCKFFQQTAGCRFGITCKFVHRCVICDSTDHGAVVCPRRSVDYLQATQESRPEGTGYYRSRSERPPNPRVRRARANSSSR